MTDTPACETIQFPPNSAPPLMRCTASALSVLCCWVRERAAMSNRIPIMTLLSLSKTQAPSPTQWRRDDTDDKNKCYMTLLGMSSASAMGEAAMGKRNALVHWLLI
jgi:hypothetical protein